jgi:excisionase family DNA binding protein
VLRVEFPPALFTKELAAYYLSCSITDIDRLRARGELIALGDGKRMKFRKSDLDRYAESLPERAGR